DALLICRSVVDVQRTTRTGHGRPVSCSQGAGGLLRRGREPSSGERPAPETEPSANGSSSAMKDADRRLVAMPARRHPRPTDLRNSGSTVRRKTLRAGHTGSGTACPFASALVRKCPRHRLSSCILEFVVVCVSLAPALPH